MHSISIFLSLFPVFINGFSQGAPGYKNVCVDMEPGHRGVQPQPLSTFPLTLKNKQGLKAKNYGNFYYVNFKIEGNFKGAIFQVRDEDGNVVGEFTELPNSMQFVESCSKYGIPEKGTVTHKGANMKSEVNLVWKSNGKNYGKVRLYASIAQSYGKIWVKKSMVGINF